MTRSQRSHATCWPVHAIGVAVTLALTGAGYLFAVQPLMQTQHEVAKQHHILAESRSKTAQANELIKQLRSELTQLRDAAGASTLTLLPSHHSNQRLAALNELAASHGLAVETVRTGTIESGERFELVPIHLAGQGSYQACTSFLHALQKQYPDTGVTTLDLSDNPGDPTAVTAFTFDLTWYAAPTLSSAAKN